jgi:hypothetical protein
MSCMHLDLFARVTPSADGCEECLKIGQGWVHPRICRVCGHVGCCDQSIGWHATDYFRTTGHPVMEAYYEPQGWGCCYIDEQMVDLGGDVTPHLAAGPGEGDGMARPSYPAPLIPSPT